ncbi:MAG: protein kinase [Coleofasciculus sp. A1-SPW-01]|uniref:serine/threonine protein kinase n=1 Tax=Coleofasciculus sp. A1-SPW-01 TaxID=3070819 RepID=UPI00330006BB
MKPLPLHLHHRLLRELVRRRGAIPETEAVRYIRQIGEALTLVHQVGLTHRDAHPGNILLRQNGKAVLIDFGIAKELVPSTYTSTGAFGNEGFAPYEQLLRGSREPNVDVHCLAATLYYTLTGQCPTKGLDRKLYQQPLIEPRRIVPGISKQVNRAILKGMALEPKKRPQSMQAWLKLLEEPRVVTPPPIVLKIKIVPWFDLTGTALSSLLMGSSLVEIGVWGVVVAAAVAGVVAVPGVVPVVVPGDWTWPGAGAIAYLVAAGVAAWLGASAAAGVAVGVAFLAAFFVVVSAAAGKKLQESFSKFHTFLILLGTSWLGLGLGWLLG